MKKKRINKRTLQLLLGGLFLFSFYLVDLGPYCSEKIATYNDGYGTFDMKSYDNETVRKVLYSMNDTGFSMMNHYYICDYFFILMFFLVQMYLAKVIYDRTGKKWLFVLVTLFPALRGIFDCIENVLLSTVINKFPFYNKQLVTVASTVTTFKFAMIGLWIASLVVAAVFCFRKKHKSQ